MSVVRQEAKDLKKQYDKTEDDLRALQSVGQIIGEVLRQLDEERCALLGGPHSDGWHQPRLSVGHTRSLAPAPRATQSSSRRRAGRATS